MKTKKTLFFIIVALMLIHFSSVVLAQENGDLEIFGLEVEKLLNLGSGLLATLLFGLTLIAYKRNKNKRLLYVSAAFILFAVKGFLQSHELFIDELPWIDPTASFLNFAILLSFFFGVLKK